MPAAAAEIKAGGSCSLPDAILAANEDRAVGGCPAGSGHDTIRLAGDITLDGLLPRIRSEITIDGRGRYRMFYVESSGALSVNNMTLGNGRDNCNTNVGGAIFNRGRINISDVAFHDHSAQSSGGAVRNDPGAEAVIMASTFTGNSAHWGGAIHNQRDMELVNTSFRNNESGAEGGAVSNAAGSVTVNASEFISNRASNGGAIYNRSDGQANISGSSFVDNSPNDCAGAECVNMAIDDSGPDESDAELTGSIAYGQTTTGSLDDSNYVDHYAFEATAGDVVAISMTHSSGDLDPVLEV